MSPTPLTSFSFPVIVFLLIYTWEALFLDTLAAWLTEILKVAVADPSSVSIILQTPKQK